MSEPIKYYRYLQFYADKPSCYSNKLFSFQITDINEIMSILAHFRLNNNSFRAIYYNTSMSYMFNKQMYNRRCSPFEGGQGDVKNFPILNPCYQRVKKNMKKRQKKESKSLVGTKKISTFAPALEQKFTHKLKD